MNETTRKIKAKGYSLTEALPLLGLSLSTYRRYLKSDAHVMHLNCWVEDLPSKLSGVSK